MTSVTSDVSAPAAGAGEARRNIEDVLPLLANQHVLVLFSGRPGDEDPGFLQVRFTLTGVLDEQRLTQAWGRVVAAHPALRTSIHERDGRAPLAVVRRAVDLPVDVRDWRPLDPQDQAAALESLLREDRQRGLDVSVAPAMRVSVLRMTDTRAEVVWTCHHILLDGWSSAIVLEDLMRAYHQLGVGSPPSRPEHPQALRSYVHWATSRDLAASTDYWRERLAGFRGAEPLLVDLPAPLPGAQHASGATQISDALSSRLQELASATQVTPTTVLLAAWSMVASLLTGEDAPVFGTTVSGRTAPVEGVERLVGYLSNAVPVRIEVHPELSVAAWLQSIRDQQFEMQSHEHATLDDVARWCSVPGHRRLFETFLVVENFPLADPRGTDLRLSGFRSGLTTASPVTVAVGMGEPWSLHLRYDGRRVSARGARAITDQFVAALEAIAGAADRTVAEVRRAAGDRVGALVTALSDDRTDVVAPRTPTEVALTGIWASLLDRPDIGVADDWFAMGGSSIAAVGLFGAISERFGVDLPLNTLLEHPTVEALARVLDGPRDAPKRCLIPIHAGGDRVPLVGIHGGRGGVLFYRNLWERLGPDQPMYVLEPVGLDGVTKPLRSVPAMARRYVRELREVQPRGPYRLVGFCFGGVVALEMAGLLEAAGEEVDMIAVIDGGLPLDPAQAKSPVARAMGVYRKRGAMGVLRTAEARVAKRRRRVAWDGSSIEGEQRQRSAHAVVARACRRAFRRYQPKPVSAPIVLIRSSWDQGGEDRDWHAGWGAYTPHFDEQVVDARHNGIFEMPGVESLAAIIRARTTDGG